MSRREDIGSVYFVLCGGWRTGLLKIGWSKDDPRKRLSGLQVGCPYPLRLVASVPGSRADEVRAHRVLADFRVRGEWFDLGGTSDLLEGVGDAERSAASIAELLRDGHAVDQEEDAHFAVKGFV